MKKAAVAACLAFSLFVSCFNSRIVSEQIVLSFDPPSVSLDKDKPPAQGYPFKVQVKDLDLDRLYDNGSVIMRNGDYTIQFSKKGSWAVRPNISASDLLQETLKANLKFRALKERYAESSPDYTISGSIDQVEEDLRKEDERSAVLHLTMQIVRNSDDQLLFEKKYSRSTAVADPAGYGALARELSLSLAEIYRLFIADAVHVFNKELETSNAKNDGKDQ
jgi:ABC-type uncharacterized transport system auxiliary subunit